MKHISILAIILSLLIPPTIQARTLEYNHTVSNNVFTENTFTKEKPEQLIAYSEKLPIDSFTKTANATQNSAIAIDNFNESFTKPASNSNESKADFISRTTLHYFAATELSLWNEREIVAAGKVGKYLYNNLDDFIKTVGGYEKLTLKQQEELFELYVKEDWKKLEELFKANNLNKPFGFSLPPANGGYNTRKVRIVVTDKPIICDRFQYKLVKDAPIDERYSGKFFSPVNDGNKIPFDQRSLPSPINDYGYYQITINKTLPFEVEEAVIIPWHGGSGKGIQYKLPDNVDWYYLIKEKFISIDIMPFD